MKEQSVTPMRVAKLGYIILSAVMCITGVLFIVLPQESAVWLGRVCAVLLIIFGIIKLIGYFSKDLYRLAFQYDLEIGIVMIVLGLLLLVRDGSVMNVLCVVFGITILMDGLFKLRVGKDAKHFGIRFWWITMVLAIITALAGVLLILRPYEGSIVLTEWIGISLLCEGIMNLEVVMSTVKIIRHQKSDVMDAEFTEQE